MEKKKRPSLSLRKKRPLDMCNEGVEPSSKKRFLDVSKAELDIRKKKPIAKNTERAHEWAMKVFHEWLKDRGSDTPYTESDLWSEDAEKVCDMLCKFIAEARQTNGEPYSPKTLLQLMTNLQGLTFVRNPHACHFMDHKAIAFQPFHNVMNNLSKKLLSEGVGAQKRQARVITEKEENLLWEKGVIGIDTTSCLLNAKFQEVQDPVDSSEMVMSVQYSEYGSKNHQGLVHQVHLDNKVIRHYANSALGERCFVRLLELYVLKLPELAKKRDIFYCKPKTNFRKDDIWFCNAPIGHNTLVSKLKDMFVEAGLNAEGVQNHSLRATGISRLYAKGFPEKAIMERSGHQSLGGIRSYERTSGLQKKEVSCALSSGDRVALQIMNAAWKSSDATNQCSEGKENQAVTFKDLQNCTLNFTFR